MALTNTPLTDAFARRDLGARSGTNTLNQTLERYGVERTQLDSSTRVKDLDTDIAERIAKRVHELDKAEIIGGKRTEAVNAFDEDEVTQFYVDELKNLVGDIGGMSRSMLKNQIKRMDVLMKGLADSSSEEKDFLMEQYSQSLTFLQKEYKNRSNIMSRSVSKMGDLAEQYMDVRSMYAGFVDDNPIAMALFRVAGDALGSYRENKKAQKDLVKNDIHRQLMAEKTEQDKAKQLERETARTEELDKLRRENVSAETQSTTPFFSRESVNENEAANERATLSTRSENRADTEFQREEVFRDDRLYGKVVDIYELLAQNKDALSKQDEEDDDGDVMIVGGLGKLLSPILKIVPMLLRGGLLALAGGAGWALGTWINDEFIAGTELSDIIGGTIYEAIENMKELWTSITDIWDSLTMWVSTSLDSVTQTFTDLGQLITDKMDAVTNFFSISDETKENAQAVSDAVGEGVAKTLSFFGFDEAEKSIAANERIADELAARNNNTMGMATKFAPTSMLAANDSDRSGRMQKQSQEITVSDANFVMQGDVSAMANKNNLDAPVQKAQEQKLKMIENQVSEIEAEKERSKVAMISGGQNLTPKSTKKSVQSTGGSQATTPLSSARNPDSSIQRNTDRFGSRAMG